MGRKNPDVRQVTITLSEEEVAILDQAVFSYGLDGRPSALRFYFKSGHALLAENGAVSEMVRQTVNGIRRHLFGRVAEVMGQISKEYGDATR